MPPVWMRRLTAACLLLGSAAVIAVLLFSDRAGAKLGLANSTVTRAGRWFERRFAVDLIDRTDVPATFDQLGHVALWGSAMLLVGWLLRHRLPVWFVAVALCGVSMTTEFLQPFFSSTRSVEAADAAANIVGIAAAAIALGLILSVVRLVRRRAPALVNDRARW